MARLGQSLTSLGNNLLKAKARVLIVGAMSLMVVVVVLGTIAVLRYSYVPVAKQYQTAIQRTLQRVGADFDSLDGDIAFSNINEQIADENGIPVTKLPLAFINIFPGHTEDLKPLRACSFAQRGAPENQLCAGVLDNRAHGTFVYLRGRFRIEGELTSPDYSKSVMAAHHFMVTIRTKDRAEFFAASFDPVSGNKVNGAFTPTPAWSVSGFKSRTQDFKYFITDKQVQGRVLANIGSSAKPGSYEFILRIPLNAYIDGSDVDVWPPESLADARVDLKLIGPDPGGAGQVLLDGSDMSRDPIFSFGAMSQHLAPGETLLFTQNNDLQPLEVAVGNADGRQGDVKSILSSVVGTIVELVTPNIPAQSQITLNSGDIIQLKGNSALVLGGWSAAAKAIIIFAVCLAVLLMMSGLVFYHFVVAPLNHVRRNTIYMRGRFSDAEGFKPPHRISNSQDEIGVLWESIVDLHRSITSYGREAMERTQKESELLRAIGHEIKSPLQDLLLRHNRQDDPSAKSLKRISYALKMLSASYTGSSVEKVQGPKEAISSSLGNITREDICEYLRNASESSDGVVTFSSLSSSLYVSADADMLEGALMAILNNAKDFRKEDTQIALQAYSDANWVLVSISNQGPPIRFASLEEVFEYGVSSRDTGGEHQGLGLFVAKQFITKMGGDISVKNIAGGVRFEIKLARTH